MFGWTILIIVFLLILTIRAIFAGFMPRPEKARWLNFLLGLIILTGGYLTISSSGRLHNALQRKNWPIAKGRVIKSEPQTGAIIRPLVIYAFEVDGRANIDTTDLQVPGFGNRSKQLEVTEATIAEFKTGTEIEVHYNPNDLTQSVIITSPPWNAYAQISLGVILFAGALFFLILPRPIVTVRKS